MLRNAFNFAIQNKNTLMFITALVFMCGILAFFNDNAILCSAIISFISILLIIKNYMPVKYIFLWVAIFYLGFFNAYLRIKLTDELVDFTPQKTTIQGQIVSIPNSNTPNKTKFFLNVNKIDDKNIKAKTLVTYNNDDFSKFKIGNSYQFSGNLRIPFKAGNPSQFDYGKYLRNFDTFTVFYSDNAVEINSKLSIKWKFLQKLNNLRDKIIDEHSKYLKSPNLEILGGIVFGDDAVAPPDYIKTSFVNSGLLHILAASGMNVAFIYGFWVFFMRRLKIPFKFTVISGMFIIILYTLMTGLGASVIRAALMLLFILAGKLIDRDAHSVSLLAFVAMLMLIYNPAFINDVGFQLSFIVTFGLLTTANVIFQKCENSKIPNWLIGAILIPIIAQIWVIPIQMFYFNTISKYSVFANVLSMPVLSLVSFGGFISSILAIFTPITNNLCFILDFILNYLISTIVFISNFFANLSNSIVTTTHPNVFQVFTYYLIILTLTLSLKTKFTSKSVITMCFLLILIILSNLTNLPDKGLQIITFDVQNADCFLIKTPKNNYFIIDTGRASFNGSKAQANSIIIKYLKDNGIKNIEGMIITHFDNDHSGGAVDIMNNFNIKNLYINSFNDKSMTSINIYKTIKNRNIPTKIPNNNKSIYSEKDLNITTYLASSKADNENSIITLLSFKDFDMLFMGDAGIEAFTKLQKDIPQNIEVLKAGHHGGPNVVNNEMLKHLNTKVSIISTGANFFGHPNKGTIDILRNTDIYRTDRHNSIKILSDGNSFKTFTFNPIKHKYEFSKEYFLIK